MNTRAGVHDAGLWYPRFEIRRIGGRSNPPRAHSAANDEFGERIPFRDVEGTADSFVETGHGDLDRELRPKVDGFYVRRP